jgi:DNA-binding beta-propeller fold protein YncE
MLNDNPEGLAIDQLRNVVYVAGGGSLSAINGRDLSVSYISLSGGASNFALGVEPRSNRIYVTSFDGQGNGVIAINGRTHSVMRVQSGGVPYGMAIDSVHDRIYAVDLEDERLLVIDGSSSANDLQYYPLTPAG